MGITIASVIGLVCAGLFRAGLKSYNYSYRQTRVLYSARKAMSGDGPRLGMASAAQMASSVDSISTATLTVTPAGDFSTTFSSERGGLYMARLANKSLQAEAVTSLKAAYYNIDAATGRIMASTAPVSAELVTVQVTMKGAHGGEHTYNFFSAALARNK